MVSTMVHSCLLSLLLLSVSHTGNSFASITNLRTTATTGKLSVTVENINHRFTTAFGRGFLNVIDKKGSQYASNPIQNIRNTLSKRRRLSQVKATNGLEDDINDGIEVATFEPKTKAAYDTYVHNYRRSIDEMTFEKYWTDRAYEYLDWEEDFHSVLHGSLELGDVTWFAGGKLNVCYNAIDRHVYDGHGEQIAMIWEGDEPEQIRRLSYNDLLAKVSQIANALLSVGVKTGDVVTLYMPMIPELAMTMLACARIGAVHSVVFAGFSAEALSQRIVAAKSKFLITATVGKRAGKDIPLEQIVTKARSIRDTESIIEKVLIWDHSLYGQTPSEDHINEFHANGSRSSSKDIHMDDLVHRQRPYCKPTIMDSEDNLFILYTSGSTGQPKGVVHTTGGYALWAAFTTRNTFDLQSDDDIFACVADCGWITGHTYVVYGPLLNGCTTFLFESTPLYPNPGRYWDMIERHGITQFYTAPTAIRSLMRYGDDVPKKYNRSSLKILGSVGEPINPEAWRWYYECIGNSQCTVVDTYWQTETGGHIITNLPGVTPMKPGSCTLPMYGIDPVLVDPVSGKVLEQEIDPTTGRFTETIKGVLLLRRPWPGMARTCLGDHERYMNVYMRPYPGYYFTGDACLKDKDGYHFITGRVDDVLNVSGHRIGTAEVESALVAHPAVAQAAVIGKAHPLKGEAIVGFVTLQVGWDNDKNDDKLLIELRNQVRNEIGGFASPDHIYVTESMPMTRSGKIMRRILRKIVSNEIDTIGDTSTLADPSVVDKLIEQVNNSNKVSN